MNKEEIMMSISMWLNDYRRKNNLTPEKIADDLECSTGYINCLLNYRRNPEEFKGIGLRDSFIAKLSKKYNVKIEEIFEYDECFQRTKQNNEKLINIVNIFRDKLIGKEFDKNDIKYEISKIVYIKEVKENDGYISFYIDDLIIGGKETHTFFNEFSIILKDNILSYLVLEQKYFTYSVESQKQRYYFDKENELFVSSIKFEGIPMLFDLNCETMISYNQNYIYQCRHKEIEEAIEFNNKIFNEITNGKTIQDIKNTYRNIGAEEEEENEMYLEGKEKRKYL